MADLTYYYSDNTPMNYLTQWDKDITLIVKGAETTPVPVFHFSNKNSRVSLTVKPTTGSGSLSVKIPNILLQESLPVIVEIYYELSDGSSRTKYSTHIPVMPKARPTGREYVEVDDEIDALEEIVVSDYAPSGPALLWVDTSDV